TRTGSRTAAAVPERPRRARPFAHGHRPQSPVGGEAPGRRRPRGGRPHRRDRNARPWGPGRCPHHRAGSAADRVGRGARGRALRSADIEVEAPTSVDAVDGQLRELFAWSVREGSTNILRHARARRCVISLDTDRLEIRNDGSGRGSDLAALGAGTGLRGLQERAESVGATVRTEKAEDRFGLIISRDRAPADGAGDGTESGGDGTTPEDGARP